MNFKSHFIFSFFAVNEQKVLLFARSAPKNAIFGAFLTDFPPKPVIFSKKTNSKSSKLQGFWKNSRALGKNSSIWRKNSSFLASKLNEPVVTNYTRYHKRVKKAWHIPTSWNDLFVYRPRISFDLRKIIRNSIRFLNYWEKEIF